MRPRQFWFTAGYGLLCAVFGVWGAYDYWVRIPRQEADIREYQAALDTVNRYATLGAQGSVKLSPEQDAEYQRAQSTVDRFATGAPKPVAAYDRPLQLWVYMIGCGIIGTAGCASSLVRTASRRYRLDDEGTLDAAGRTIAAADVTGIDMTRWMAKSIARLEVRDGPPVVLDDYKFAGMHLIVGHFAQRFMPNQWNADATAIRRGGAQKGSDAESGSPDGEGGQAAGNRSAQEPPPAPGASERLQIPPG